MRRLSEAFYFVAITLWVGGMWAIGYMVAPVLFSSLGDRQLAGLVAGKLFSLIGKYAGDIAQVQAPGGIREYEIIDVRYE